MPRPTSPSVSSGRLARSPLADDLSFLLARANALAVSEANAALAEHGLKVRAFAVLELAAADMRPSQRELADFLRLDPSQVVALVDDLQRRGLVERLPDPEDRRANVVVATHDGVRAAAAARVAADDVERRVHARLSDDERAQLTEMLQRIALDDA